MIILYISVYTYHTVYRALACDLRVCNQSLQHFGWHFLHVLNMFFPIVPGWVGPQERGGALQSGRCLGGSWGLGCATLGCMGCWVDAKGNRRECEGHHVGLEKRCQRCQPWPKEVCWGNTLSDAAWRGSADERWPTLGQAKPLRESHWAGPAGVRWGRGWMGLIFGDNSSCCRIPAMPLPITTWLFSWHRRSWAGREGWWC